MKTRSLKLLSRQQIVLIAGAMAVGVALAGRWGASEAVAALPADAANHAVVHDNDAAEASLALKLVLHQGGYGPITGHGGDRP